MHIAAVEQIEDHLLPRVRALGATLAKKRDDLQAVIQACKEHDFGIPLQFGNFRD